VRCIRDWAAGFDTAAAGFGVGGVTAAGFRAVSRTTGFSETTGFASGA
jgi:hypothetical protein